MMDLHLTEREADLLIEALAGFEADALMNGAFAHHLAEDDVANMWANEAGAAYKLRLRIEQEKAKL